MSPRGAEERHNERVTLEVSREHGALQLSINVTDEKGCGHGYRIAGPKFSGGSKPLLTAVLSERDVAEIRQYLDWFDGGQHGG